MSDGNIPGSCQMASLEFEVLMLRVLLPGLSEYHCVLKVTVNISILRTFLALKYETLLSSLSVKVTPLFVIWSCLCCFMVGSYAKVTKWTHTEEGVFAKQNLYQKGYIYNAEAGWAYSTLENEEMHKYFYSIWPKDSKTTDWTTLCNMPLS